MYIHTRIKRELRARNGVRDQIMGLYYGMVLVNYITGLNHAIILWIYITGLYYEEILQN